MNCTIVVEQLIAGTGITLDPSGGQGIVTVTADVNGGSGSPGGSDTQVQYNDGGSFGGDANFTWDAVNNELQVIGSVGAGTNDPSFFTSPANGFKAEYNGDGDPFFCWERDNAVSEVDRQYCFYVAANSGFLTLRDVTAGDNLIYWNLDSLTTIDGNLTFDDDGDSLIIQNNNYAFRTTGSAGLYFDNAGGEFEYHTPSGVPVFIVDVTGADAGTGTFNNNLTVLGDINAHNSGTVASDLTSTDGFTNQRKTSYENSSTHNLFTAFAARGTDTSPTILQNDDQIDSWRFRGYDGSAFRDAASINVEIDGTPGSSDMPGRIVFSTTPDGASSVSEVLRLNADQSSRFSGDVNFNTSAGELAIMAFGGSSTQIQAEGSLKFDAGNLDFHLDGTQVMRCTGSTGFCIISRVSNTPEALLHVLQASAGSVTANTNFDDVVIENSANSGMSILSPDASSGGIFIGSPSDSAGFQVRWSHDDDLARLGTANAGDALQLEVGNTDVAMVLDENFVAIHKTPKLEGANITISGGIASLPSGSEPYIIVNAQTGTTDTLDTLNPCNANNGGAMVLVKSALGDTIVINDAGGNIQTAGVRTLNSVDDNLQLFCNGVNWGEVSYANNS